MENGCQRIGNDGEVVGARRKRRAEGVSEMKVARIYIIYAQLFSKYIIVKL